MIQSLALAKGIQTSFQLELAEIHNCFRLQHWVLLEMPQGCCQILLKLSSW